LSRREVAQRRSASLLAEQELATQRRQEATLDRDIADIEARLASIPHEMRQAEAELATTSASIVQRTADAEQRRSQFIVRPLQAAIAAPARSTANRLARVATVAIVIPSGSQLEAELLAPSRSIGFIKPGRMSSSRCKPFRYSASAAVSGTIRTVSATVLAPGEVVIQGLNIQEPVYRIRVTMGRDAMSAYGETIPMQPGMLVSADIVFDRRSLIEWLFDPIYAVARRT